MTRICKIERIKGKPDLVVQILTTILPLVRIIITTAPTITAPTIILTALIIILTAPTTILSAQTTTMAPTILTGPTTTTMAPTTSLTTTKATIRTKILINMGMVDENDLIHMLVKMAMTLDLKILYQDSSDGMLKRYKKIEVGKKLSEKRIFLNSEYILGNFTNL